MAVFRVKQIIQDNIEYDYLLQDPHIDNDRLNEIVDLMLKSYAPQERQSALPGAMHTRLQACFIVPIAAAKCMSIVPTTASV